MKNDELACIDTAEKLLLFSYFKILKKTNSLPSEEAECCVITPSFMQPGGMMSLWALLYDLLKCLGLSKCVTRAIQTVNLAWTEWLADVV